MSVIQSNIQILLPLILVNLILVVVSLRDVFRTKTYKFGNTIFWVCVILFVQIIGPIIYLILGRDDS
ncbi:MAG: PLDc N-terminal domain-containing protein [Clostridioides sp.]|jgi:hypothetical protein|nr:PLDc N-terminal domain-containing protein [Clostridioides sp.]